MRNTPRTLAIVGERNPAIRAHQGIEASLAAFRRDGAAELEFRWIGTAAITPATAAELFRDVTGIWCAPGSPYADTAGALRAIRHARESGKAFLGTCGGFQHALMDFAQNVLGREAVHQELEPDARQPLIMKLSCSLVGAKGRVIATDATRFAGLLGGPESIEEFHCNYGFNGDLAGVFGDSALAFVAHDELGQVRAFRLDGHPFFVGTLFQPERRALTGTIHPLVQAFLQAV